MTKNVRYEATSTLNNLSPISNALNPDGKNDNLIWNAYYVDTIIAQCGDITDRCHTELVYVRVIYKLSNQALQHNSSIFLN